MKKMLLLLFVFAAISTSAFAAIQVKLTVVSTRPPAKITVFNLTTNTPAVQCIGTTPCTFSFNAGTKIQITATPQEPSTAFQFFGWDPVTGNAIGVCGTDNDCAFTITQETKATAKILQVFTLRVFVGSGSGNLVKVKKDGVEIFACNNPTGGATLGCSRTFVKGSVMRIENIAGPNQKFGSYSNKTGSVLVCSLSTCNFILNADSSLLSNFVPIP